jgi:hypothetical protein
MAGALDKKDKINIERILHFKKRINFLSELIASGFSINMI